MRDFSPKAPSEVIPAGFVNERFGRTFVLGRIDVFALDLYECGLADRITELFNEMNGGIGCVRKVLSRVVTEGNR